MIWRCAGMNLMGGEAGPPLKLVNVDCGPWCWNQYIQQNPEVKNAAAPLL